MTKKIQITMILISSFVFLSCPYDPRGRIYDLDNISVELIPNKESYAIDDEIMIAYSFLPDYEMFKEYRFTVGIYTDKQMEQVYESIYVYKDEEKAIDIANKEFIYNQDSPNNGVFYLIPKKNVYYKIYLWIRAIPYEIDNNEYRFRQKYEISVF